MFSDLTILWEQCRIARPRTRRVSCPDPNRLSWLPVTKKNGLLYNRGSHASAQLNDSVDLLLRGKRVSFLRLKCCLDQFLSMQVFFTLYSQGNPIQETENLNIAYLIYATRCYHFKTIVKRIFLIHLLFLHFFLLSNFLVKIEDNLSSIFYFKEVPTKQVFLLLFSVYSLTHRTFEKSSFHLYQNYVKVAYLLIQQLKQLLIKKLMCYLCFLTNDSIGLQFVIRFMQPCHEYFTVRSNQQIKVK